MNIALPHVPAAAAAATLPRIPTVADRGTLVDAWKATTNEREKARIEELLWMTSSAAEREAANKLGRAARANWLLKYVETPNYDLKCRAALNAANPEVDELWARVEKREMSLGMAVSKLVEARKVKKRDGSALKEALARLLAEYDTWPKRREGMYLIGVKPVAAFSRVRVVEKKRKASPNDDREFWMSLRELLQGFVQRRTAGAPPHIQDVLIGEFERELKVVTTSWNNKMERAKQRSADNAVLLVTRVKVTKACGVLNMDPPKPGKPADMKLAQSRKRMLAKTYHPDVSPHTRDQYEAVLEAYATLEDYEEMLKSGGTQ